MPTPHDYDCMCERCRQWHATIAAQNPDGSYFFTDEELYGFAMQEDADEHNTAA